MVVMAGLDPAIHAKRRDRAGSRGCPDQVRARRLNGGDESSEWARALVARGVTSVVPFPEEPIVLFDKPLLRCSKVVGRVVISSMQIGVALKQNLSVCPTKECHKPKPEAQSS